MDAFRNELVTLLPALRAFARSLCGDPAQADDLVQESLLKAWAARSQFRDGTNMKAWVFTILRNVFFSSRRSRKHEVPDPEGLYAAALSVEPEHEISLEIRDVDTALRELSADQREALVLVYASGMSCEEAATICGCPVGTIKSRMARGRDRLVELLGATPRGTVSRTEDQRARR